MSEFVDSPADLDTKYSKVFRLVDKAKYIVFFTGAGISTAADIPDYRGDKGLDKAPLNIAQMGVSERDLDCKMPTAAHRAITLLLEHHPRFKFVVTSNHDGLHQKSGTPWERTANVFGTAYIEECLECRARYTRRVITPALHRVCDDSGCGGKLKKTGVRYGQTVPPGPLRRAEEEAEKADLIIVLGSSMGTSPFCQLPSQARAFVLCNKQTTNYDRAAKVCIHDDVNAFMDHLLKHCLPKEQQSLNFTYEQEFVVREEGAGHLVLTSPRHNEPAVFVDSVYYRTDQSGAERSFERQLNGNFSAEVSTSGIIQLRVEFKEGPDMSFELTPEQELTAKLTKDIIY